MLRIEYFDKDRFMRQVSASHGSVLLHLDNGKTCDLKKDATASSILRMMNAPKKGFDITVTEPHRRHRLPAVYAGSGPHRARGRLNQVIFSFIRILQQRRAPAPGSEAGAGALRVFALTGCSG